MINIETLIQKYLAGVATEAEKKVVDDWYASFEMNTSIRDAFDAETLDKSRQQRWDEISRMLKL